MSTSGDDACGGYHDCIGGCSVHWRATMMYVGGHHEYIGVFNVNQRLS